MAGFVYDVSVVVGEGKVRDYGVTTDQAGDCSLLLHTVSRFAMS